MTSTVPKHLTLSDLDPLRPPNSPIYIKNLDSNPDPSYQQFNASTTKSTASVLENLATFLNQGPVSFICCVPLHHDCHKTSLNKQNREKPFKSQNRFFAKLGFAASLMKLITTAFMKTSPSSKQRSSFHTIN